MKKIILDCDLMRHRNSGLYYYCLNLGHYVQQMLQDDVSASISFYIPPAEKGSFGNHGQYIAEAKDWRNFFKPFLRHCDVWHSPFQSGRIVPDKKKYPHIKVLLTIHDLNQLHEGKPVAEQQKSLAHTQSLINRADAIVCISEFCKQDVLLHCDISNKPLYVIQNGIHRVEEPLLLSSSIKPTRPFLFGMGYVNRKKNYHVLLPLLKDESLEMVIAGKLDEPDYVSMIKQQATDMGVVNRLHLPGPVTDGEKSWYLQNCLAFVHPSLAEGFGAPVVEAMKFGKPLFISSLTSLPEIGGEVAFYFHNFEPCYMQEVFTTGMQRYHKENMSAAIKNRALQFDWRQKAKEYLAVYKKMTGINK